MRPFLLRIPLNGDDGSEHAYISFYVCLYIYASCNNTSHTFSYSSYSSIYTFLVLLFSSYFYYLCFYSSPPHLHLPVVSRFSFEFILHHRRIYFSNVKRLSACCCWAKMRRMHTRAVWTCCRYQWSLPCVSPLNDLHVWGSPIGVDCACSRSSLRMPLSSGMGVQFRGKSTQDNPGFIWLASFSNRPRNVQTPLSLITSVFIAKSNWLCWVTSTVMNVSERLPRSADHGKRFTKITRSRASLKITLHGRKVMPSTYGRKVTWSFSRVWTILAFRYHPIKRTVDAQ